MPDATRLAIGDRMPDSWMNGYADIDRDESRSASADFTGPYDEEDRRPTKYELAQEERDRRG